MHCISWVYFVVGDVFVLFAHVKDTTLCPFCKIWWLKSLSVKSVKGFALSQSESNGNGFVPDGTSWILIIPLRSLHFAIEWKSFFIQRKESFKPGNISVTFTQQRQHHSQIQFTQSCLSLCKYAHYKGEMGWYNSRVTIVHCLFLFGY